MSMIPIYALALVGKKGGGHGPSPEPGPTPGGLTPEAEKCTKASCWDGSGAEVRCMNMLAPRMNDTKYNQYKSFMQGREANTAHLILCNQGDVGSDCPSAGDYCIYGNSFDWTIDQGYCLTMLNRLNDLRNSGFHTVLWLTTDDSNDWNAQIASNPTKYCADLKSLGFFDKADIVCIGLEVNEYWSIEQAISIANALRNNYSGTIAVHMGSNNSLAYHVCANTVFLQIDPGSNDSAIRACVEEGLRVSGKPCMMFELERHPARDKCNVAFAAGAYGVGNW